MSFIMGNLCRMSWDILLIHLPWSWYQTAVRSPAVFFFFPCKWMNWSILSALIEKCTWGTQSMWALLSLYVFVWVCVCVRLSVDSGALMLKDVSSFLHCTGLLWRSCWAALMSCMCHCRTFSSETTARGDQNGMFILHISALSLLRCHSLPVTHSFTVLYARETNIQLSFNFFEIVFTMQFCRGGIKQSYQSTTSFYVLFKFLSACVPLFDWHCCCSCYPPFLIVLGWIATDRTCHILPTRDYP